MVLPVIPRRQLDLGAIQFFEPVPEVPAGNQIRIRPGWISVSSSGPNRLYEKDWQITVGFLPVSGSSRVRWDLAYLDKTGTVHVLQGVEQVVGASEFTGAPAIPRDEAFPVAYVKIDETGAVLIDSPDITDIRPKFHFWERIPPGSISMWLTTAIPEGWLWCNGETIGSSGSSAVHKGESYRDLFNTIKTYPPNTGAEDFDSNHVVSLPDFRNFFPVGYGAGDPDFGTIGGSGGVRSQGTNHTHGSSMDTQGSHNHTGQTNFSNNGGDFKFYYTPTPSMLDHTHGIVSDGAHSHNITVNSAGSAVSTIPPFKTLNFIIKM